MLCLLCLIVYPLLWLSDCILCCLCCLMLVLFPVFLHWMLFLFLHFQILLYHHSLLLCCLFLLYLLHVQIRIFHPCLSGQLLLYRLFLCLLSDLLLVDLFHRIVLLWLLLLVQFWYRLCRLMLGVRLVWKPCMLFWLRTGYSNRFLRSLLLRCLFLEFLIWTCSQTCFRWFWLCMFCCLLWCLVLCRLIRFLYLRLLHQISMFLRHRAFHLFLRLLWWLNLLPHWMLDYVLSHCICHHLLFWLWCCFLQLFLRLIRIRILRIRLWFGWLLFHCLLLFLCPYWLHIHLHNIVFPLFVLGLCILRFRLLLHQVHSFFLWLLCLMFVLFLHSFRLCPRIWVVMCGFL